MSSEIPSADLASFSCPLPITTHKEIVLGHGSGGKLSQQLIQKIILPQFKTNCSNHSMTVQFSQSAIRDWPTALIHLSLTQSSFPVATSARSPSTEPSTTSPCAARARSTSQLRSSSKKDFRSNTSGAWFSPCRWPPKLPVSASSPATPKSSTAAKATNASSPPPASVWFLTV